MTVFAAPGSSSADFEEMTFMLQKTMERKMKSLSRRRISTTDDIELWGAKGDARQRVSDIEKLRSIYEQLDNTYNLTHLDNHAKHLYGLASRGEDFSFNDSSLPAGSYIQLKEAENIAVSKSDKKAEEVIKAKLAELDEDESFSRKIDAGLNTAVIFKDAYSDSADRSRMRTFYYNNILDTTNAAALMQALVEQFGEKALDTNLDSLVKAVLADMSADKSSSGFKHLATQLKDLNRIQSVRSVVNDSGDFIARMKKHDIIPNEKVKEPLDLAKDILVLSTGSIFSNDLDRIAKEYAGEDPDNQLTFMNAFHPFLKNLPEGIWPNGEGRLTGLQTILVHLQNETAKVHKAQIR
ncbi:HrpJ domain-containing protein [Exilibacterium tricleocarpae]|uniref:HrpJ domain-containing protein n=1 Tax=Exilibacterium tricleocarpae TaxID=2591008 RepID=UPI0015D2389C|nr:HrpJ domain-containing protein [Exilibacterium tricleocarpae]